MQVKINLEDATIIGIYNAIAKARGFNPEDVVKYSCTKCKVSSDLADAVEETYSKSGSSDWRLTFGMQWCCYGPMVDDSLPESTAEIEDGFMDLG